MTFAEENLSRRAVNAAFVEIIALPEGSNFHERMALCKFVKILKLWYDLNHEILLQNLITTTIL